MCVCGYSFSTKKKMDQIRRYLFILLVISWSHAVLANDRPIIGVLAQESPDEVIKHGQSYFYDSYVDYLQMAGARVVPVRIYESGSYYEDLFKKINGVLFPGGAVNILTSGYAKAAQIIFKLAMQANDQGDHFPLWGTCLGHELMTALVTNKNLLSATNAEDYIVPLNLKTNASEARLLQKMPDYLLKVITTFNVTANFHHAGLLTATFNKNAELKSFFRVISTNIDRNGSEFVSTMEAYNYPFYTTQWHPETNIYRWDIRRHINHSAQAVLVAQYLANYFVDEARKSNHRFNDIESESQELIYNYQTYFSGPPSFERYYFFNYTKENQPEKNNYTIYFLQEHIIGRPEVVFAWNVLTLCLVIYAIFHCIGYRRNHAMVIYTHPDNTAVSSSETHKP